MNKKSKNIVLVGFKDLENRSIDIPLIGKNYYLNNMEEAKKHQGYLIIINNKDNVSIVYFDKKYRKVLNKYTNIWLYHEKYKEKYNKWSNIKCINRDLFYVDSLSMWEEYDNYKVDDIKKYTNKRKQNIEKLYNYLKGYKVIKTSKIKEDLNMNDKMVQRYMSDINDIYHNIGYDYSNNEWYIIW